MSSFFSLLLEECLVNKRIQNIPHEQSITRITIVKSTLKFPFTLFVDNCPCVIPEFFVHEDIFFVKVIPFLLTNVFTKVAFEDSYIILCKTFWTSQWSYLIIHMTTQLYQKTYYGCLKE